MALQTRHFFTLTSMLCVALCGCAGAAPIVELSQYGREVRTGTSDPVRSREVGPIEVKHGVCNDMRYEGSYEGVLAVLRNRAARMGATYVKILQIINPLPGEHCIKMRGIAYGTDYSR